MTLALVVLFALPGVANAEVPYAERCSALVYYANAQRSTDVRVWSRLCQVAYKRASHMADTGTFCHDLGPVMASLDASGVCWRSVGEVLAWHTPWVGARTFVSMWMDSPSHETILIDRSYDRGGGYYDDWGMEREYAVYYHVALC